MGDFAEMDGKENLNLSAETLKARLASIQELDMLSERSVDGVTHQDIFIRGFAMRMLLARSRKTSAVLPTATLDLEPLEFLSRASLADSRNLAESLISLDSRRVPSEFQVLESVY